MRYFSWALIYIAFFGLIGAAVYWTESGLPLFALLLTPSTSVGKKDEKETKNEQ